jgi:hypothetical protein
MSDGPLGGEVATCGAQSTTVRVPFTNQSRMPLVYRMGDVVLCSARHETWGLAQRSPGLRG